MGSSASTQSSPEPQKLRTVRTAPGQIISLSDATPETPTPVLVPNEFRALRLSSIKQLNHNLKLFRFNFPDETAQLPKGDAACFYFVQALVGDGDDNDSDERTTIMRPYTPVSPIDARGYLTLMVKIYAKPYGKMGNHLASLAIGDTVNFRGPIPKVEYRAGMYDHVVMLAGGSGITPMYQMLQTIWGDPNDTTRCTLLFSVSEVRDVVLRDELQALQAQRPHQLKIVYTVSRPPPASTTRDETTGENAGDDGTGNATPASSAATEELAAGLDTGRIDEEKLRKYDVTPDSDVLAGSKPLVLVCGPPGFTAALAGPKLMEPGKRPQQGELLGHLKALGFTADQVYKF